MTITNKLKLFFLSILPISILGCNQTYSHEYLLSHPDVVQSELAKCRKQTEFTAYCDMVKHTSDEFESLENVRATDPLAFGKQIIQSEIDSAAAKDNWQKIRDEYQQMKMQNPANPDLKDLQNKLIQAEHAYQMSQQKVQTLLAVVGSMSAGAL